MQTGVGLLDQAKEKGKVSQHVLLLLNEGYGFDINILDYMLYKKHKRVSFGLCQQKERRKAKGRHACLPARIITKGYCVLCTGHLGPSQIIGKSKYGVCTKKNVLPRML